MLMITAFFTWNLKSTYLIDSCILGSIIVRLVPLFKFVVIRGRSPALLWVVSFVELRLFVLLHWMFFHFLLSPRVLLIRVWRYWRAIFASLRASCISDCSKVAQPISATRIGWSRLAQRLPAMSIIAAATQTLIVVSVQHGWLWVSWGVPPESALPLVALWRVRRSTAATSEPNSSHRGIHRTIAELLYSLRDVTDRVLALLTGSPTVPRIPIVHWLVLTLLTSRFLAHNFIHLKKIANNVLIVVEPDML